MIDTEYLAAVERGDMDTARRLMVEFAVSKGYVPVEVYHGTLRKFYVFDATRGKKDQPGNEIRDAVRTPQFFSFNEEFAKDYATFNMHWRDVKRVRLIKAFLRYEKLWDYRNPEDVDAAVAAGFPRKEIERGDWRDIESRPFQRWLLEQGYDAFTNFERFAVNIAVFKPSQIKSAETVSMKGSKIVPLSKRFDVTKDDIRNPRTRSGTPPQFPYEYAAYLKKNFPSIWAKGGNIRGNDTFRWWTAYRSGDRSPTVMHWWNVTRPAWIARHFRDHRLPGVIAQIKWGTVGTLGVAGMKRVVEDAIRYEIR